ncbi:hypothetical protein HMI54_014775 [Coelomomyces lativittatus]|nr:hypothetical protein HMI56_000878 [Coelomomyces lativittatus]KAJ1513692.1 hypothetical protein HMI54_014775 [Coelomomyces lativittatus]
MGNSQSSSSDSSSKLLKREFAQRIDRAKRTGIVTLSNTKLKKIPSFLAIHGHCIKSLDLSHNRLKGNTLDLHSDMFSILRILNLSHNELTSFPSELVTLHTLETLDLSHNSISTVSLLPISLKHLHLQHNPLNQLRIQNHPNLIQLNLQFTQLVTFTCEHLPELESLDLSHNQLREFIWSSLNSLKHLSVHHNSKFVGSNIFELPSLMHLEFEQTRIRIDLVRDTPEYKEYEQRRKGRIDQLLKV